MNMTLIYLNYIKIDFILFAYVLNYIVISLL